MTKTVNYNLNKPETADPLRVADFNENADKIDGLLKQVDDNSITRSAQVRSEAANALAAYQTANDAAMAALSTAVETLNAAATGFGNCKIASGSYVGNGKYGSANPTKLEVGFTPRLVLIGFGEDRLQMYVWPATWSCKLGDSFSTISPTLGWGDTFFSLTSTNATAQMNTSGSTYYYIVIG